MKRERYHPEARNEVVEAACYLEEQRPEYGDKFLGEIDAAVIRLTQDPMLWRTQSGVYRKYITPRFKYLIWYRVTDDEIFIAAVHHGSRRPGYWKKRILEDEQR